MRTITIPLFGAEVPGQGGVLGAILRGAAADGSEDYALIVPDSSHDRVDVKWADKYKTIPGCDSQTDGLSNTAAMAAAGLPLAADIATLDLHGHKDWYLPAAAELRALQATVPELFDKSGWYWSSTQYSSNYAWCQAFEDGSSSAFYEGYEFRARPIRKVQLHTLST